MDIYATHLPVLKEIGRVVPIMNVLELGAGSYSTAAFCSGDFPAIRWIDSYETDWGWYNQLRKVIVHSALTLNYSNIPLAQVVASIDISVYDLIFIDDGKSKEERVNTILAVMRKKPNSLIVIHDFEQIEYQRAAVTSLPSWCWSYTTLTPHTGLVVPYEKYDLIDDVILALKLERMW